MDKILLICEDEEKYGSLLQCLKILFPECPLEVVNPKTDKTGNERVNKSAGDRKYLI